MDLIFFGMQGSGKGTLGKILAQRYKMQIFETGAALRMLSQENSELGRKVKSIIEAGKLVPNDLVMEIVSDFMEKTDPSTSILFDGIPRKIDQAISLNALLDKNARKYKAVLLEINQETALKRLTTRRICEVCKSVYPVNYLEEKCKCGGNLITRSDDNPEAIKTRLEAFKIETIPSIELYRDKLVKIDGESEIEDVAKLAFQNLDSIMYSD